MAKIRIKSAGKIIAWIMRALAATLRWQIRDDAGVFDAHRRGCIWGFWHNRMFLIPWTHQEWFANIPGTILTSPSGDGQIIADLCASFGIEAARGSSSKPEKGMSALITLAEKARAGHEIGITPDGPRGPIYQVQPGIIKLAQLTGVPLIPVHIHYSRAFHFKTWDRFMLPLPFSTITLVLDPPIHIPRRMTEEEFEQKRKTLEDALLRGNDPDYLRQRLEAPVPASEKPALPHW
ncbi:lysophospholipid acyltransferase family protein [Prosthecobacter sp.]|uniref:lysophospholipid acyltransferase family protein n=1 Tax=Prosthecobacter sp. TaxID=1965333 RepID=UPI0037838BC4